MFKKGDKLTVDDDILCQGHTWVPATHQASGQTGFIPSRFVIKDDNSLRSQEWWFDLNKEETEERLMSPCYKPGTFLIRDSSDKVSLVLSVKSFIPETLVAYVYHYKIKRSDHGQFFISPTNPFANIPDLISFYR
ncbi:tyrosine protein-kinase src-2-like, partial [Mercenaria mercenaria]|uniref:tyrosine protein-kinase src-2-like n=1 Tax=Mercenaria mercenaria TaxID=6596 RepID=UPI00234EB81B